MSREGNAAHKALLTAKITVRSTAVDLIERLHVAFVADEVWSRATTIRALEECSLAAQQMKDAIDRALAEAKAELPHNRSHS